MLKCKKKIIWILWPAKYCSFYSNHIFSQPLPTQLPNKSYCHLKLHGTNTDTRVIKVPSVPALIHKCNRRMHSTDALSIYMAHSHHRLTYCIMACENIEASLCVIYTSSTRIVRPAPWAQSFNRGNTDINAPQGGVNYNNHKCFSKEE